MSASLFEIMRDAEDHPDFQQAQQDIAMCSLDAQRVIGWLKMEFEWKSGWLNTGNTSRYLGTLRIYRTHFRAMPESPTVVEAIAWRLFQTCYWQAYYQAHKRSLPDREAFHQRYFVTLPTKQLSAAAIESQTPRVHRLPRAPRTMRSWKAIRFSILQRDKYCCRICGQSPANTPGTILEVDHITPRVKGGNDDPINLWTLCFACNRGKWTREL